MQPDVMAFDSRPFILPLLGDDVKQSLVIGLGHPGRSCRFVLGDVSCVPMLTSANKTDPHETYGMSCVRDRGGVECSNLKKPTGRIGRLRR